KLAASVGIPGLQVDVNGKVDWHNYGQAIADAEARGPGEHGAAVELPKNSVIESKKRKLYKVNGFNALVSDLIPLNRSLPDIRHPNCAKKRYLANLPTVSIVIPFHNEHLSTLLRTVTSVINRSPKHLIKEVILADDYSSKPELGRNLENAVAKHFKKRVKIIRAKKREGLIRTRLLGARAAIGDVLLFLDSHTEANINWLPPLLEPIAENPHTVACPFIDVLDYDTLAYRAQDEGARGSFDWELYYKRLPLLDVDRAEPSKPFKSPVMAGGLFAINREYFWQLGGYDEGLDVWGGEQYELSFKIWQCGGQMLDVPCSRVGHVYRQFAPFPNPGIGDFVGRNYRRVAEVWMDEYKNYLYNRRPHYRNLDYGDISKQKALRERLKCKSFQWFMEKVAFDQPLRYPPIEPPDLAWGKIRNVAAAKCLDSKFLDSGKKIGLDKCIGSKSDGGSREQNFVLTWHQDLRPAKRTVCLDVSSSENKAPVVLWTCHGMQGNQLFKYNLVTMQLRHPVTAQCLDADPDNDEIFMNPCTKELKTQKWEFEHVNTTAIMND
ncbi:putative polypeptide N-acetylgalactosaminyltransferase 10-like, partial [Tropilaelaps mercedesae]